jgi:hypothetical protein
MLLQGGLPQTFGTPKKLNTTKGGSIMAKPIEWETSLTKAKTKAKKEKKLILMDFYNNL